MMEYSVDRGVACCGLICFRVGLENLASSALYRVSGRSGSLVVPKPVDYAPNEERVEERFSCCNT